MSPPAEATTSIADPIAVSQSQSQSQSESDCLETKDAASAPPELEVGQPRHKRKSLSFFLAFISLLLMVFLVSLDATTLAVAIPVRGSRMKPKQRSADRTGYHSRPRRHHIDGILGQHFIHNRSGGHPAHLHQFLRHLRPKDPSVRRVCALRSGINSFRCSEQYGSPHRGTHAVGSGRRRP